MVAWILLVTMQSKEFAYIACILYRIQYATFFLYFISVLFFKLANTVNLERYNYLIAITIFWTLNVLLSLLTEICIYVHDFLSRERSETVRHS